MDNIPRDVDPKDVEKLIHFPAHHWGLVADIAAQERITRESVIREAVGSFIVSYAAENPDFKTHIDEVTESAQLRVTKDEPELAIVSSDVPVIPTLEQLIELSKKVDKQQSQGSALERLASIHKTAARILDEHSPVHLGKIDPATGQELLSHDGRSPTVPDRWVRRKTPCVLHGSVQFNGKTYEAGYRLDQMGDTWKGYTETKRKTKFTEGESNDALWKQEPITLAIVLKHPETGITTEFNIATFRDENKTHRIIDGPPWSNKNLNPLKEADAEKITAIEEILALIENQPIVS